MKIKQIFCKDYPKFIRFLPIITSGQLRCLVIAAYEYKHSYADLTEIEIEGSEKNNMCKDMR